MTDKDTRAESIAEIVRQLDHVADEGLEYLSHWALWSVIDLLRQYEDGKLMRDCDHETQVLIECEERDARIADLEDDVDRLKDVNGDLCAEINRQQQEITDLKGMLGELPPEGRCAMTSYECDVCGKTLHYGEMYTATVKRVGNVSGRTYELCKECADKAKSVLAAFVMTKEVRDD